MSKRPEERANIDGGGEPSSSLSGASPASDGGGGGGSVLIAATVDDGRGDNASRRMLVATKSGSEEGALPTADDHQHQRDSDEKTQTASPSHLLSRRRGVASPRGGRTYQFRKAKSAATFTLDGVSYTIGEYRTKY